MARTREVAQVPGSRVVSLLREPAIFLALHVEHQSDEQGGLLAELDRARVEFLAGGPLEYQRAEHLSGRGQWNGAHRAGTLLLDELRMRARHLEWTLLALRVDHGGELVGRLVHRPFERAHQVSLLAERGAVR